MRAGQFKPIARVSLTTTNDRVVTATDSRLQILADGAGLFTEVDLTVLEMQIVADGVLYAKLKKKHQQSEAALVQARAEITGLRAELQEAQGRNWIDATRAAPALPDLVIPPCIDGDDYRSAFAASIDR